MGLEPTTLPLEVARSAHNFERFAFSSLVSKRGRAKPGLAAQDRGGGWDSNPRPCRSKSRLRRITSSGSPSAHSSVSEAGQSPASRRKIEVADGTRTHDHLDHNQG